MDSFQYAQSVQERAQSAYEASVEDYNQERQIATAHFEAEKKEIVDPLSFIGGGLATSAAKGLGKKLVAKTGIKAFENLGQESISATMKKAAAEALEKGKSAITGKINGTIQNAISKDGGKDLINKTLKENGYDELTDEDFANPSTLGDKILKQSVSKAKAKVDLPEPEDVKTPDAPQVDDLNDVEEKLPPEDEDYLKDILSRYPDEFQSGIQGVNEVESSLSDLSRAPSALSGLEARAPTHLNQLGDDDLPDQQRVQAEMEQNDNSLGRDLTDQDTVVNGQPKPPDTDQDAIRPASPKPDGDPVPEPEDADAVKAGEEVGEEGSNILSKLTEVVGTADVATGGADIAGDLLEGVLGLAGLFLPGSLDTQSSAPPAPKDMFRDAYEAGTGVV